MNRVTTSVLNTVAASAADIVVSNGTLSITGCPSMQYEFMKSAGNGLVVSLYPTPYVTEVIPTAAANTTYTLLLTQYVMPAGRIITRVLSYTTPAAGATATSICDFLRLQLASYTDIQITGSGTSSLILTGSLTSPLFTAVNTSTATMSVTSSMPSKAVSAISNAAPRVATVVSTTNWFTGMTVTIAGTATTNIDGVYRITIKSANTFELDGTTASGAVTGAGITATLVAQVSRGQYSDLLAAGVVGATAGSTYSQVPLVFGDESGLDSNLNQPSQPINRHTPYVFEGVYGAASATNFAAFKVRMGEVLNAYVSGGTTSDPALIAIQH